MTDQPLRILLIGAHPDDADIKAGGTAAKWCALGHVVRLVSLPTNGQAGHQTMHGPDLARRRRAEAQARQFQLIGATVRKSPISPAANSTTAWKFAAR